VSFPCSLFLHVHALLLELPDLKTCIICTAKVSKEILGNPSENPLANEGGRKQDVQAMVCI